ncbi:MAG: hydroxylase [Bacteroidetes bacterium]|nr:hydroxylase [Bacteroidota bacterium]
MKFFTKEILELVRGQSRDAEINGRISHTVLDMIYTERLFKLFVPDRMNGRMMDLADAVKLFEEASYIDGSFGWLVTIGSGGGYFSGIFEKDVSQRLFTLADAVIAGSGFIGGSAKKTSGGYQVSGSWKYCSGADFATIFTANCLLEDGAIRSFIFTPDQVTVHMDWDAFGMKATGSHTISVQDVYVPEEMTFDISNGRRSDDAPIFAYPFIPFAEASFAAVNIGVCKHFIEEARESIKIYNKPNDAAMMHRYTLVSQIIREQEQILNADAERFHKTVEVSWQLTTPRHLVSDAVYTEVDRGSKKASATALDCAHHIYRYLGLAVVMESSTLNRCWRDLHTASQHVLLRDF